MAGTLSVITGVIVAGSGATLMARLRGNAGQLVTQASLTSISYTVTDLTAGTVSSPVTVSVAACVFDNLQQGDPRWSKDSANDPGPDGEHGYNALVTVERLSFSGHGADADGADDHPRASRFPSGRYLPARDRRTVPRRVAPRRAADFRLRSS